MPQASGSAPTLSVASHATEMQHLINDIDYLRSTITPERVGNLSFHVDDIPYEIVYTRKDEGYQFQIRATLGYLPFSAESVERREAIQTILAQTKPLFSVQFGIEQENKIVAVGAFEVDSMREPDFIFYPLALFIQEARPFIHLIGSYL